MNDFTKEELERILEGVSWWLDGDNALYSEKLIDKLKTMIENYCNHEWRCFDDQYNTRECTKCGEEIQGEIHDNE